MKTQKSSEKARVLMRLLACIGVLAVETCAGQGVVYVTPSQPINYGGDPWNQNIDITGSGNADFVLGGGGEGESDLYPQGANSVVQAGNGLVAALNAGSVVGPNPASINPSFDWWVTDQTGYVMLANEANGDVENQPLEVSDNFAGITAYIGFVLVCGGQNYYGWMEVENPLPVANGSIVAWAYATTPNTPMVAGAGPLMPLAAPQIVRPGNLRLTWQSYAGQAYQVQFKHQVDAPSWSNSDLTIIATATNTAADIPMTGAAAFYRVIQVP